MCFTTKSNLVRELVKNMYQMKQIKKGQLKIPALKNNYVSTGDIDSNKNYDMKVLKR